MKKFKFFNTLMGFAVKAKALLAIAKSAKYAKFLVSSISMLVSAIVYGWQFGLPFGAGLVGMLFVHEMGHAYAIRKLGLKASLPVFIPMLGAVIFSPPMEKREDESFNGFMGPFVGTLGTLVPLVLMFMYPGKEIFPLLVYIGLWINLFNLILVIRPFDGGRVLQVFGSWYKWIGLSAIILMALAFHNPGMLVLLLMALNDFSMKNKDRLHLYVGLSTLTIAGHFAFQSGWAHIITDTVLCFLFTLLPILKYDSPDTKEDDIAKDDRPYPSSKVKWYWGFCYITLLVVLVIGMVLIHPYIPVK